MTSIEVFTFLIVLQFPNRFLYKPVVLVHALLRRCLLLLLVANKLRWHEQLGLAC